MLADFAVIIEVASVLYLCKTNSFLMSFFFTIITKEILGRIVAFISFMGRIATVVARK
jgi:hypothetical protein